MGKSLVKKFFHVLGSSAVALSLGVSGASAFGKDIILGGVLLFTGPAGTRTVAELDDGTMVMFSNRADVRGEIKAKPWRKDHDNDDASLYNSLNPELLDMSVLESDINRLVEEYCRYNKYLVGYALISVIAKGVQFYGEELAELTRRANYVTRSGEGLECKKEIEKSSLVCWLAEFLSRFDGDEKERIARLLVTFIYTSDSKGHDNFYREKAFAAKKVK